MSFLNPKFYSKHGINRFSSIMYEDNRPVSKGNRVIQSIVEFYTTTDFYSNTGISLLELMELDMYTYQYIRKQYENYKNLIADATNSDPELMKLMSKMRK